MGKTAQEGLPSVTPVESTGGRAGWDRIRRHRHALRISRLPLSVGFKPIAVPALREPDDSPYRPPSSLAYALNPVIPVLEDEIAASTSHDHRRWFPAFLGELLHHVNSVIPILFIDRAQDRVARWPGESLQSI
jgi:hypothetical protein